jgi:2-(1,2-epoxy-1,2-dihydrophenyl)acetyl-CoA isomerase
MNDHERVDPVLTRRDGAVLIVTMNRPAALNSLDDDTLDALLEVWTCARASEIRAVVLTGSGRAFCAGADIRTPARAPAEIATNLRRRYNPNILAMRDLEKPIVAAVNGAAAGAGLSLALAADLRIASDRAAFVPAFARIGSVPDAGASYFLARLLGESRAYDWLTSDRKLLAEAALEWGLVNEVVPHEHLIVRALDRAHSLADLPGEAASLTKRLLRSSGTSTLAQQLEHEVGAQAEAVAAPGRDRARSAVAGAINDKSNRETMNDRRM